MDFPAPIGVTDIFNPSQFPQTFSLLEQFLTAGAGVFLNYPIAQGSQTWEEAGFTFVLGAEGLTYNGTTTTWANLQTKIEAIQALSQASNSTTLNVNNTISIQYGETTDPPTQSVVISSDATGNKIAIDGAYGTVGQAIVSGGGAGGISWGTVTSTTPTLEEVLTSAVGANDAGNNEITGLSNISINDNLGSGNFVQLGCIGTSIFLSTASVVGTKLFSGTYLPIYVDGEERFIQLFQDPPPP